MTFIIRNIALLFLLIALVGVTFGVYLSGRTLYEYMLNRAFAERMALVETLGDAVLSSTDPNAIAVIDRALHRADAVGGGTRTFRLIDPGTRRIIASSHNAEEGAVIDRPLPETALNRVIVTRAAIKDDRVVELTYLGPLGVLWLTLNESFFVTPAVVFAVQHAFIFIAFATLLGFITQLVARRYFVRPLKLLKQSLVGVVPESGAKHADDLGSLLESFAGVAQKVEETLERDRLVSQMKSDFISTTAHQLRTPLSGINWALGALLSDGNTLTEQQRTLVERALEKDKELINLIGTLLNAASIEEGKFGYHREPVSLKSEIEQTIEEERQTAAKSKVQLNVVIADETFPDVFVDKERIRWVLRNLIENALRYSQEGGEVVVALTQDPKQIQVAVKDNGIGIALAERAYIFQKFFRSDAAQKLRNDGSGLGLFIAKNIVNYHGGRIWFETEEGKGSTFYFTLPVSRRETPEPQA